MSDKAEARPLAQVSSILSPAAYDLQDTAAEAAPLVGSRTRRERMREWILQHDDSWVFIVLYVGLAVVLSIWISLFWLVAVVGVHFIFEVVRQQHLLRTGTGRVVLEALWELKLDIALVIFALALTLYMPFVLGVVGLQGAARIGAASRAAARFAGWERTLRGILLSADDAAQVVKAAAMKRAKAANGAVVVEAQEVEVAALPQGPTWREPWTTGTWIAIALGVVCVLLIVAAPLLTDHTAVSALLAMAAELHPYP